MSTYMDTLKICDKSSNCLNFGLYNKMVDISKGNEWCKYCVPFDSHDILNFPVRVLQGMRMVDYLEKMFSNFSRLYTDASHSSNCTIKTANYLSEGIIKTIKTYLEGKTGEAYNCFVACLDGLKVENATYPLDNIILKSKDIIPNGTSFYRMRAEEGKKNPLDFYHLPFNMRYLCGSMRFSVAGYPCFYTAYSSNCCILETNPKGSVGKFEFYNSDKHEINMVDLTMDANGKGLTENVFLAFWPLIAACYVVTSAPVKRDAMKFKEEYIIPQFLTQYILEHKVNASQNKNEIWAMRYYSTRKPDLNPRGTGENDYRNVMFFTQVPPKEMTIYDDKLMSHFRFISSQQI